MMDLELKALHLELSFLVPCSLVMEYLLSDSIYKAFSAPNNTGIRIDYFSLHKMGEMAYRAIKNGAQEHFSAWSF